MLHNLTHWTNHFERHIIMSCSLHDMMIWRVYNFFSRSVPFLALITQRYFLTWTWTVVLLQYKCRYLHVSEIRIISGHVYTCYFTWLSRLTATLATRTGSELLIQIVSRNLTNRRDRLQENRLWKKPRYNRSLTELCPPLVQSLKFKI